MNRYFLLSRALRRLLRILRYRNEGVTIPVPWWADRLTVTWTWKKVPIWESHRFAEPTGVFKRGFVIRREGIYLTRPMHHDLAWYRRHMKLCRKVYGKGKSLKSISKH